MTRDELKARLVGRTIVGVDFAPDFPQMRWSDIEAIRLDDGTTIRPNAEYMYGDIELGLALDTPAAQPGFAGSMWGEPRTIDGVELVPLVDNTTVPWSIASLVVSAIASTSAIGMRALAQVDDSFGNPMAVKVEISHIKERWIGAPYADWLALPR